MKKVKKKKTFWIAALGLVSAVLLLCIVTNFVRVRNVFDEIYRTWDGGPFLPVLTQFKNVPSLSKNRIEGEVIPGDVTPTRMLYLIYDERLKEKRLRDNTDARLMIVPDERKFLFYGILINSNNPEERYSEYLDFIFEYDVSERTLKIMPLRAYSEELKLDFPEHRTYDDADDGEYVRAFLNRYGITREDIEEYKDYFLNEVLIGMWVDGNGRRSRFTREDPGTFTVIDNSYQNLGEDW